jgi:hypothetical protein
VRIEGCQSQKKPANSGLLQFSPRSSDAEFDGAEAEIVESPRQFFEIFPFSGDCGRRTRFDLHCAAAVAVNSLSDRSIAVRRARKSFDKIGLANSMFPCLMARQGIKGIGVVAMRQRIRIKGEKRWI